MLGAGSQALVLALVLEGAVLVVCLGGDVHVVMNEQTHTANSVDSLTPAQFQSRHCTFRVQQVIITLDFATPSSVIRATQAARRARACDHDTKRQPRRMGQCSCFGSSRYAGGVYGPAISQTAPAITGEQGIAASYCTRRLVPELCEQARAHTEGCD